MKRTLMLVAVALALVVPASARQQNIGIGVEYVLAIGPVGAQSGFAVTGKPPVLPVVFGIALGFAPGYLNLGVTADWWLYQKGLGGPVGLYVGPGLFFRADLGLIGAVAFGARGVFGLQLFPLEVLEFFLEAGVNVGVYVGPGGALLSWGVPVSLGARFWF